MQHLSKASGNNEWYTPPAIVEAIRHALGGEIGFDPCSCETANEIIRATVYLTQEDDALTKLWPKMSTFMNPPYERGLIDRFVENFVAHRDCDKIALVNNATETKWFQMLLHNSNMICFLNKRVKFLAPEGKPGGPLQGQVVIGKMQTVHGMKRFESSLYEWGFVSVLG